MPRYSAALIAAALLSAALPATAHQSFAAEFDDNRPVTLTGTAAARNASLPDGRESDAASARGEDNGK